MIQHTWTFQCYLCERENHLGLAFDSFLTLKDAKPMLFKAAHYWKSYKQLELITRIVAYFQLQWQKQLMEIFETFDFHDSYECT